MDPHVVLAAQLRLAARILERADAGEPVDPNDAERLAELVQALDGWLVKGGFLPPRWTR